MKEHSHHWVSTHIVQLQKKRDMAKKVFLHCETEAHRDEWRRLAGSTADSFTAAKIKYFEGTKKSCHKKIMPHW